MRLGRFAAAAAVACVATLTVGCRGERIPSPSRSAVATSVDDDAVLGELRAYERRAHAEDDGTIAPSNATMGADPYDIVARPEDDGFFGVLRGRDALVALDADGRETARWPTVPSPTAIAAANDDVWVGGELEPRIAHYRRSARGLERLADATFVGPASIRGVAIGGEGIVYATDEVGGRLVSIDATSARVRDERRVCNGPTAVVRTARHVIVDCLLDHTILVAPVGEGGIPLPFRAAVKHDGPIWSIAAVEIHGALIVVAGGVEDAPLDRRAGFFGNVDSFLFAYAIDGARTESIASIDLSELGVVTPKAIAIVARGSTLRVTAFAFGSASSATFDLDVTRAGYARVVARRIDAQVPGVRAVASHGDSIVAANPLVDSWDAIDGASSPRPVESDPRDPTTRAGEALFFTTLMAPWDSADGAHSRFTCETCHFEGFVDGRTHFTGRGDVHATTKPLVGLRNNRPHFSRALDPDLSSVAHNEFRVAGAGSGVDPWFSLGPNDAPWLTAIGVLHVLSPVELREALMRFLMRFEHRESPIAHGRSRFTPLEAEGARAFAARCASCHAPRAAADDPSTAAPFDAWEASIFAPAARLVWASSDYAETGVTPYVHARGARVPSLRRLYKKRPYFTNGSAKTIDDVLARARFTSAAFWHDDAPDDATALAPREREALAAFLALL